jgi:hypothetical protein
MIYKSLLLIAISVALFSFVALHKLEPIKLIAHRGGVVEDKFTENSMAALEEAIKRKYWMIEVDIRETKDGVAIVHHDPDFRRYYNLDKKVNEMTWPEIAKLESGNNTSPLTFEELVKACQGKLRLMLDTKEPHAAVFCIQIESILKKYNMLADCYVIGTVSSRNYFVGKAKVGASYQYLSTLSTEAKLSQEYFLFEHGNVLSDEMVSWAKEHHITVVPSVNKFHYKDQNRMMELAEKDVVRLKDKGVTEFQIDSEFDRWF